jgi:hypothetical protein
MDVIPDPSDPEAVLNFLREPVEGARNALDDGVSFADTTLHGQPPDAHLWAHLVRYRARLVLDGLKTDWGLRVKANSGFEIVHGPFVVRTLKAQDAGPPHPGKSVLKRSFYSQSQQIALNLGGGTGEPPVQGANLILDWNTDDQRNLLVALSKPKGVWAYRGQPDLEWRRVVRFDPGGGPRFEPMEEDVIVEPIFDLSEVEEDGSA